MAETVTSHSCPSLSTTGSSCTARPTTRWNSTSATSSSTRSRCPTLAHPRWTTTWAPSPTSTGRSQCTRSSYPRSPRRRTGRGWTRCPPGAPATPAPPNRKRDTCACTAASCTRGSTASKSTWGLTRVTSRSSAKCASGRSATPATWTNTSVSTRRGTRRTGATFAERCWCGGGTWRGTSSPGTRGRPSRNRTRKRAACSRTRRPKATMTATWTCASPTTRATKSRAKIMTERGCSMTLNYVNEGGKKCDLVVMNQFLYIWDATGSNNNSQLNYNFFHMKGIFVCLNKK